MVVDKNDRRRGQFEGPFDNLPRIDRRVVDRAFLLHFICNQHVLFVQKQDAELFGFAVGHCGVAVIQQRIPTRQQWAVHHAGAHHALGGGFDDLEFSSLTNPPLTTVRQPRYEMGRDAARLLVTCLEQSTQDKGMKICYPPEIVIRRSTSVYDSTDRTHA